MRKDGGKGEKNRTNTRKILTRFKFLNEIYVSTAVPVTATLQRRATKTTSSARNVLENPCKYKHFSEIFKTLAN